jgi:hypothetical protein
MPGRRETVALPLVEIRGCGLDLVEDDKALMAKQCA